MRTNRQPETGQASGGGLESARAEGGASKESKEGQGACEIIIILPSEEEEEEEEISVGTEPLDMPSWGCPDMIVSGFGPLATSSGVLVIIEGNPQVDEPEIVKKALGEQSAKV